MLGWALVTRRETFEKHPVTHPHRRVAVSHEYAFASSLFWNGVP